MSENFFRNTLNMLTQLTESPQIGQFEDDQQLDEGPRGSEPYKGNHKPGWMLRADPALGKKVADRKKAARPPLSKPSTDWEDKQLDEGCWSLPDTPEKVKGLARLLSKPLHADAATHALYNYIGDDDLFDKIDSEAAWMDAEGVKDRDIRDLVIGWMKRNVNRYENSGIDKVLELLGEPLNEVLTQDQQNQMTAASPGVAQAQTNPTQAANTFKQTTTTANSAAANANAAAGGMQSASQKLDQLQAQPQVAPKKPVAPMAQNKPTDGQYVIKKGDTLSAIAKANGTTVQDIMKANPQIKDPNRIAAGAGLTLPQKAATPQPNGQQGQPTQQNDGWVANTQGTGMVNTAAFNTKPQNTPQQPPATQPPATQPQTNVTTVASNSAPKQRADVKAVGTGGNWLGKAAGYLGGVGKNVAKGALQQVGNFATNAYQGAKQGYDAADSATSGMTMGESVNIGTIVKIHTAPGMLSKARVTAINEGQYTVQTRSGTQYTVGFDDLWVKTPVMESKKLNESVDLDAWMQEYNDNEENNYHSENILLVAELVGTPDQIKVAQQCIDARDRAGYLPPDCAEVQANLQRKLWPKVKELFTQEYRKNKTMHESNNSDLDAWMQEYNDNEDANAHSENILHIAKLVGSPNDVEVAQKCIAMRDRVGYLPNDASQAQQALYKKLWPKVQKMFTDAHKNKTMHESDDVMAYSGPSEYETNQSTARELLQQARGWIEQGEDFGTVREILMAMVDDGAANPSDVKKVLAKINNELLEADCVGLGEKTRRPKAPRGPVVEGETCCTVKYKMKKSDPKITVAEYDSREAAEKFLASIKAKGGNGIITDKKKLDELSKDTLKSYSDKAGADLKRHSAAARADADYDDEPMFRRMRGIGRAVGKLEELSKDTLKSYTKKAKDDLRNAERIYGHERAYEKDPRNQASWKSQPGGEPPSEYFRKSAEKRSQGIDRAIGKLEEKVDLGEKAVSKKQQQFMGMVHAAQKGEPPASKKVADVAKTMKKGDVTDFAKTKHKGLPKKVKKTDESTCAGSIAVVEPTEHYGNEANMKNYKVGQGVYESKNTHLEKMISESMSINVSLSTDPSGKPTKSININATDEDAEQLSRILNLAGIETGQPQQTAVIAIPADGEVEMPLEENMPDWPTNTEVSNDPFQYSGGLNKPKVTGQTTGAPVNVSPARGSFNENVELERTLFRLYQDYKGGK